MNSLRPQISRYVRALKERDDHPDERQDLGTFLTWLLRRSGYLIRLAPFHYEGPKRRVSKGRYQQGIDLVASRPSQGENEGEDLFLFVLKPGNVGRAQWRNPDGIIGDLQELGNTSPQEHERWLPSGVELAQVNVVVVHNGEFDDEALSDKRRNLQARFERDGFRFEWWSALELVEKTLAVVGEGSDHELFPPTVRPFYGALLDALETSGEIAIVAVERLLEARFPDKGKADELHRSLTELSVFAGMMSNLPRARSQALLATLDMLLTMVPRCAAAVVAANADRREIRDTLADLLATFVEAGDRLAQSLQPLAELDDGLSWPTIGEQIDWPLRTMRVLRDLVLTVRAASDLATVERDKAAKTKLGADRETAQATARKYDEVAKRCLELSLILAERNLGAVGTPITDDQLIEYVLLWRTWLDGGHTQQTKRAVEELITRLVVRRHLGFPGPALYQHARTPMTDADARALAETWSGNPVEASTVFEDKGSTIVPLAIFVADRLGVKIAPSTFMAFGVLTLGGRQRAAVHPQSWSPPEDASQRWYDEDLSHSGICHIYEFSRPENFPAQFERRQNHVAPSPMQKLGLECIDAMAWVHQRTRPPLIWLLKALTQT